LPNEHERVSDTVVISAQVGRARFASSTHIDRLSAGFGNSSCLLQGPVPSPN